ncbi:MAG: L-threonylcarbamoyladenylate synthase [Cyanobacterium sp. T60_A2020_053]|nr:L-threonylcarbamoyladenylate synthase [Cyanobacterium sp. T60_A2020_053]
MPLVSLAELVEKSSALHPVSFPTDTIPALAVYPHQAEIIFQLKQRPTAKPLILMTGEIEDIWQYVKGTSAEMKIWRDTAQKYLPGALTLVLPASELVPKTMNPLNPDSIGVRVPNHPIAREILRQTGAMATTSANVSGEEAITDLREIARQFPSVYALDYDNQIVEKTPSTVIKWTDKGWEILRQGKIKFIIHNS